MHTQAMTNEVGDITSAMTQMKNYSKEVLSKLTKPNSQLGPTSQRQPQVPWLGVYVEQNSLGPPSKKKKKKEQKQHCWCTSQGRMQYHRALAFVSEDPQHHP